MIHKFSDYVNRQYDVLFPQARNLGEMWIWSSRLVKFCFLWARVVSFPLVHPELNWFPCASLPSSAKCILWIGLRFWNQTPVRLPSTFSNEFLSKLNCKVNLIHANVCSIISCSAKRLLRAPLLCCSHTFIIFLLHSLVPPWVLHKLIGHLVPEVTPPLSQTHLS